jgi:DNA-directed RNA polymerase specialized sigma subunit
LGDRPGGSADDLPIFQEARDLPGDERTVEEVEQWFLDYQRTRDPKLRERIILAHLGLVDRLASRFRASNGLTGEDLVQAARVGLVAAVDRYDPARPNPFIAYAIACINGELRRCLRDSSWRVHVTRTLKELALRVIEARDTLTAGLKRSPTLAEVGDHLGLSEAQVAEAPGGGRHPPPAVARPADRRGRRGELRRPPARPARRG